MNHLINRPATNKLSATTDQLPPLIPNHQCQIGTSQVWTSLTMAQQQMLFHTLVSVCRRLINLHQSQAKQEENANE